MRFSLDQRFQQLRDSINKRQNELQEELSLLYHQQCDLLYQHNKKIDEISLSLNSLLKSCQELDQLSEQYEGEKIQIMREMKESYCEQMNRLLTSNPSQTQKLEKTDKIKFLSPKDFRG